MSTSSYDSVFALGATRVIVPVGATLAVLMTPVAGQNSILLKYFSGGTCEIIGCTLGQTLSAADLSSASGSGYLLGSSEILQIDGPARYYLSSTGATTTLMLLIGKSQGT
jgi:hypothetical protein